MVLKLTVIYIFLLMPLTKGLGQEEQLVINLSPGQNNRIFTFENPKGSIKVTGYEGTDIVVAAAPRFGRPEKAAGKEIKRIGRDESDLSAESDGRSVILYNGTSDKTVDFDIKIPRDFSLKLKSLDNGTIQVININGEIVAENASGDILLENITGSSVLSTVYGQISATFRQVKPDSPMMFTSFEGDISIEFPATVNATLKMKSGTGEIQTDFELVPVRKQPAVKNAGNTKVITLEDWITGRINAGGPEFVIRSYNGDISIRKKQGFK